MRGSEPASGPSAHRGPDAGFRGTVFFDVDGTLVPQTSSGAHLGGLMGRRQTMERAESDYAAGILTNRQVCEIDAAGWAGHHEDEVLEWLGSLPLVDGIAETLAWCAKHRLAAVLATLAWQPVGAHLARRYGFHTYSGPMLETVGGRYTGGVTRYFDEYDKRDSALAAARALGVPPAACAAVGDSRSDLPLFASVGLPIAFNASAAATRATRTAVSGNDLTVVIPVLEGWLS